MRRPERGVIGHIGSPPIAYMLSAMTDLDPTTVFRASKGCFADLTPAERIDDFHAVIALAWRAAQQEGHCG